MCVCVCVVCCVCRVIFVVLCLGRSIPGGGGGEQRRGREVSTPTIDADTQHDVAAASGSKQQLFGEGVGPAGEGQPCPHGMTCQVEGPTVADDSDRAVAVYWEQVQAEQGNDYGGTPEERRGRFALSHPGPCNYSAPFPPSLSLEPIFKQFPLQTNGNDFGLPLQRLSCLLYTLLEQLLLYLSLLVLKSNL